MKFVSRYIIVLALLITFTGLSTASEITWYNFNEAVVKAQAENKHILVDFYTDWCTWCKKLDSDVYSKDDIINKINENFVAVKLNPEKEGEVTYQGDKYRLAQFAQAAGVTGYPATGFFNSEGKFIQVIPGFLPADKFMSLLNYFDNKMYTSLNYQDYMVYDKFNELIAKNPDNPEINYVLGFFEHKILNNSSKAIDYYKKALENEKMAVAYAGLSQIAADNKNAEGSKRWMEKAEKSGYKNEETEKEKLIEIVEKYMKQG